MCDGTSSGGWNPRPRALTLQGIGSGSAGFPRTTYRTVLVPDSEHAQEQEALDEAPQSKTPNFSPAP